MSGTVLQHGLPSSIQPGAILGGKYRLESELGRGTLGTVWSAAHVTLGQRVTIKLILVEYAQHPDVRRRFSMEAKAVARLKSRFVVQVHDDGETPEGAPYVVLEWLLGETLAQRLARERALPLNDAVRVTRHVGRALSRAHAQGIVHRDLKPANVFLARSDDDDYGWIAKVLDFGMAKLEEAQGPASTRTGPLLGASTFMSPEQMQGLSGIDKRTDLYSLGMIFYNMVTGQAAFSEAGGDALVAACTQPLPRLSERAPHVPESVAEWFERACARNPVERFPGADEMLEALELALGVSGGLQRTEQNSESAPVPVNVKYTLRGHASPLGPAPPVTGSPAAALPHAGMSGTQRLTTDPRLDLASAHGAPSVRESTLDRVLHRKKTRWLLVLGACALGATLGAAALLASGWASTKSAESAEAPAPPTARLTEPARSTAEVEPRPVVLEAPAPAPPPLPTAPITAPVLTAPAAAPATRASPARPPEPQQRSSAIAHPLGHEPAYTPPRATPAPAHTSVPDIGF